MGFDTHMILEAVPAPHSKRPDSHLGINRTPRHYAEALVSYQRPEGLKAFGWDVREPKAEEDYVVTAVRLPGENGTQRHTASPRSQARGPGAAVSQSMNAAGTPDRKTVFHGKSSL